MREVTIPNSVKSIGARAFCDCFALKYVTNYATAPQPINEYVFHPLDKSKCTLYVPAGSISTYKSTENWKEFNPILTAPIQEEVELVWSTKMERRKVVKESQILIVRGDKTYTLQGQEVK